MHTQEYYKHFDIIEELEGYEQLPSIRHMAYRNRRRGAKKFNLEDERAIQVPHAFGDSQGNKVHLRKEQGPAANHRAL